MIIYSADYKKSQIEHMKDGNGTFYIEDIASNFLGQAGRQFIRGCLKPNDSVGKHTHIKDMEICYFLQGEGTVLDNRGTHTVKAGDCNVVMPGEFHEIVNNGKENLTYIAAVLFPQK